MKAKTIKIATLIIIAEVLLLLLFSCSKEEVKPGDKLTYSFYITPVRSFDKATGVIHYTKDGLNSVDRTESISANGFATSVELLPGESLSIAAQLSVDCYIYIGYNAGEQSKYRLVNGEAFIIQR